MKKGDYGYERLLLAFRSFYCCRFRDGPNPLKDGCTHRAGKVVNGDDTECPHQTGWICIHKRNPGNVELSDLVMDNL